MQALKEVREKPGEKVLLFQDETSFYRQPSQGWLWAWMGRRQPKVMYSHQANTRMRVAGFMEAVSGRVLFWDMARVTVKNLAQCIRQVSAAFPQAESIYIVWDNWPVHKHSVVQAAIMKDPRIKVLPLPTYAPWLNAIEKLWRLVRQEIVHAHPWCDNFSLFRSIIKGKLEEFACGSARLVRYCGLSS